MKITLKGVPPSLNRFNGRQNTWEYRKLKESWTNAAAWAARAVGAGKAPPPEKALVIITYHFRDSRRRDPDNYSGKFLLDGLTRAGAIKDDDFGHIDLMQKQGQPSRTPYTEVEIYAQNSGTGDVNGPA